jgi:hypothetical protein
MLWYPDGAWDGQGGAGKLRGEDECGAGLEHAGCGARLGRAKKRSMARMLKGKALWENVEN